MSDQTLSTYADAISSVRFHPSDPNLLVSTSWDGSAHLHDLSSNTERVLYVRGALLDAAWGPSPSEVFVGGLSREVRGINFETSQSTLYTTHTQAVSCIEHGFNTIVSGSWDKTIHLSPLDDPSGKQVLNMPAKVYALALNENKLVAVMGDRKVQVYDTRNLSEAVSSKTAPKPWQERESSLKFLARAVAVMPDSQGYVVGSVEGRVAVEYFNTDEKFQKEKKYAFKCHRQTINDMDTVFPVQAIAFNTQYGTFATGGGDGVVSLWDLAARKRIRQYPKYPSAISDISFNADNTRLAVAYSQSDDFGFEGLTTGGGNGIAIKTLGLDAKPKEK